MFILRVEIGIFVVMMISRLILITASINFKEYLGNREVIVDVVVPK